MCLPAGDLPPLAQRLERRKRQPSLHIRGTIDSWDFPTVLLTPSPTQSHRRLQHPSLAEQDEKYDVLNEWTRGDGESPSPGTEHDAAPSTDSPSPVRSLSPPNTSPSAGCSAATVRSESAGTSTRAALPTAIPMPFVTALSASPERASPPPSPSLWSRIRRPAGHSEEASRAWSGFINGVLNRGRGGREATP